MNPITREESLLDGQDLTPITRKEQFIKKIYDKTQEIPEPITREEWFLKKAGEGTSPVAIEQLNVTENGTYSEAGKAYSPVIVDVPAPTLITKTITENGTYTASEDNADGYSQVTVNVPYMEKKSASGDIASFSDGAGYPFLKVKANINPVQDLRGYDNPWAGGAGKNKINAPDITLADAGDIYNGAVNLAAGTYTLSSSNTTTSVTVEGVSGTMPLTFTLANAITTIQITASGAGEFKNIQIESGSSATSYAPYSNICPISGFTGVNVANVADKVQYFKGLLDGTYGFVDMGTLAWVRNGTYSFFSCQISDKKASASGGIICEKYTYGGGKGDSEMSDVPTGIYAGCNTKEIKVKDTAYTDAQTFKTAMNGVYLIYELATPTTPTITPTQFNNLLAEFSIGGAVYPISWQDEAGIVYGGYIDLVSGVLTKTLKGVDLGTLDWSIYDSALNEFRTTGLTNNKSSTSGALSSHYTITSAGFVGMEDGAMRGTSTNLNVWVIRDTRFTDPANFKTAMSGVQLVHELATPQTYNLTPQQVNTLIGQNNVWNNTNGQTEVEYIIPIE